MEFGCMARVSSCMKKYNLDAPGLIWFHLLATKGENLGFDANSVLILMLSRSAIFQSGFALRIQNIRSILISGKISFGLFAKFLEVNFGKIQSKVNLVKVNIILARLCKYLLS